MPYFNRHDICAAHWMFATLFHTGQGHEIYAKFAQLSRLRFNPSPLWSKPRNLPENAREIYNDLVKRHIGVHHLTLLPEQYLHVVLNRSGEHRIIPIADDQILDIAELVDQWIESQYCGEVERDGRIGPSWDGDYWAEIKTDGRKLDSPICWDSGGFYLKSTY